MRCLLPPAAALLLLALAPLCRAGTTAEGKAFLAANKEKEDVVTLPSGLQYKVIQSGQSPGKSPLAATPCECHYAGTLIDGTEFDSSYKRGSPATFAPNQVVRGWTEAMQLMKEGDKWELYLPSELACEYTYPPRAAQPRLRVCIRRGSWSTLKRVSHCCRRRRPGEGAVHYRWCRPGVRAGDD
eukprot:COSAG01_NODE_5246_length_4387_cov_10.017724_1_plen_184_part_00